MRVLGKARQVVEVVVDVRVDLLLSPGRGRLEHPEVLERVVAELEDVVVLVGDRHLQRLDRRARKVDVVVVEHEIGVAPGALLALVRSRVAVELAAQVGDVDVDLTPAADAVARAAPAVGLRVLPVQGIVTVLDRVRELSRSDDLLEEGIGRRRVALAVGEVNAEVIAADRRGGGFLAEVAAVLLVRRPGEELIGPATLGAVQRRERHGEVTQGSRGVRRPERAADLRREGVGRIEGGAGGAKRGSGVGVRDRFQRRG